jgi:UDP-N-acetylglucosamine 2-epimerase
MRRLTLVVGARPQFVKLAPLARLLPRFCRPCVIHTGQHYDQDMSEVFFQELQLPTPDHHLGVGSASHGAMTGRMLEKIEEVLMAEPPDLVVVFGDTNSTLAAALAAAKLHLPVAHVEAGLRSFAPMPEEINRVLTDRLSTLLFAPSQVAVEHLAREGITRGVHEVGDLMLDATRAALERGSTLPRPQEPYLVMTLHREESTRSWDRLEPLLRALEAHRETILFPCHPRTRKMIRQQGWEDRLTNGALRLMDPVGHQDMLGLARHARLVLTDSGGLQKEAYFLGTPCLTLREETEWVETVQVGWNRLVGLDPQRVLEGLDGFKPAQARPSLYGDGHAAERIAEVLEGYRHD